MINSGEAKAAAEQYSELASDRIRDGLRTDEPIFMIAAVVCELKALRLELRALGLDYVRYQTDWEE